MPSIGEWESVIESMNFMLASDNLAMYTDLNILYDNVSLARICEKFLKIQNPSIEDMNKVIAVSISWILSGCRFSENNEMNTSKLLNSI